MPFRSPKMYSFIFGFQRLVWWPKWTPASSRSFIAIAAKLSSSLPFTELEALARSRHAVLLAFLRARVAREEPLGLERLAQIGVVLHERARDAESHGARLSRDAATIDGGQNIELIGRFRENQRLTDLRAERFGWKERFERTVVD